MTNIRFKNFFRLIFFIVFFLVLFFQIQFSYVVEILSNNTISFLIIALALSTLGNIFCAKRWKRIFYIFSSESLKIPFIKLYFESISASTILPGGILSADIFRTIRGSFYINNPSKEKLITFNKHISLSVFFDRLHGLWALCVLAILAFLLEIFFQFQLSSESIKSFSILNIVKNSIFYQFYIFFLFFIITLPILKINFLKKFIKENYKNSNYLEIFKEKKIFYTSLFSQFLFATSYFFCLCSIGVSVPLTVCFFFVPGIFLFAALPLSIAGFGPREAGALIFLTTLNLDYEQILVSSILFGIIATIQGLCFLIINLIFSKKHS